MCQLPPKKVKYWKEKAKNPNSFFWRQLPLKKAKFTKFGVKKANLATLFSIKGCRRHSRQIHFCCQWLHSCDLLPCWLRSKVADVADTLWSVHIKCCFYQKKAKSKHPATRIRHADTQSKGCDQSSTKNVTNETLRFHSVTKQDKVSDKSVWTLKTNCTRIKSNKIWFEKTKSEEQRKEANRAEESQKG